MSQLKSLISRIVLVLILFLSLMFCCCSSSPLAAVSNQQLAAQPNQSLTNTSSITHHASKSSTALAANLKTTKSAQPSSVSPSPPLYQANATKSYQHQISGNRTAKSDNNNKEVPPFDMIFPDKFSKERIEKKSAAGPDAGGNLNRDILKQFLHHTNQTIDDLVSKHDQKALEDQRAAAKKSSEEEYEDSSAKSSLFKFTIPMMMASILGLLCMVIAVIILVDHIQTYNRIEERDRLIGTNRADQHQAKQSTPSRRSGRRRILDDQEGLDVEEADDGHSWMVTKL